VRTNKPSATAVLIAASLACDFHDPGRCHFVPALAADLGSIFLRSYGPPANFFSPFITQRWLRILARALESVTIPGITLHYLLRKRYIEDTIREHLKNGIEQVIVLGGGFDTLAIRLHTEFPTVNFIELDHPGTQRVKIDALKGHIAVGENLDFIEADFTIYSLEEILLNKSRYDSRKNSLFLCEGVLMYLSELEVGKIFDFIHEKSGPKSIFLFTFMEKIIDQPINFHNRSTLVDFWMKLRKEPFVWGIERQELESFLHSIRFSLLSLGDADVFRDRYLFNGLLKHAPLATGESIVVARNVSIDL